MTATPSPADVQITGVSSDLAYSLGVVVFLIAALFTVTVALVVRGGDR